MVKRGRRNSSQTLDDKVTAMVISEFPLDSILTTSQQMQEARKGLVEYVKAIKPDVIFVDGLFQRMKDIETYRPEVRESNPMTNFMELPMHYAAELFKDLHKASPATKIQYTLSDADEENIRALTAYRAEETARENQKKVGEYKKDIAKLNSEIRDAKKDEGAKRKVTSLEQKKAKLEAEAGKLENNPEVIMKKPKNGTQGLLDFKESTANDYMEKLRSFGIDVFAGEIKLEVKGCSMMYAHSYVKSSSVPLKSVTGRLVGKINEMQRSNVTLPDFIIESGHHAEPMAHPHRHKLEHKYSLVAIGMVLEDQVLLKEIRDKHVTPELFQGKQSRLEAAKRQEKKTPASGVMLVGRDKEGYFAQTYTAEHLANVGAGKVKLDDMVYETFNIVSDAHVGKQVSSMKLLKVALKTIEEQIDTAVKAGRSAPIFVNPNESLQGSNYSSYPVETSRQMTEELVDELKEEMGILRRDGKLRTQEEAEAWFLKRAAEINDSTNEPRIINQVDRYYRIFTRAVIRTLANSKYDIAAIFTEATHINHTVGEFGITEVGLETLPVKVVDMALKALIDDGKITSKDNEVLAGLYKKIKTCESGGNGYDKFTMKFGDVSYSVAAEHKPGSAGPNSNLPMLHVRRINSMEDDAEILIAGHLHTPYFVALGHVGQNNASYIYKGATFSEYDNYGKAGGWSTPVMGYLKAEVPINPGGKGTARVKFVLSDYLETRVKELDY